MPSATSAAPAGPLWQREYGWATGDNALTIAATFSLVKGLTPRQALRIVAPDAATPIEDARVANRWVMRQPYHHVGSNAELIVAGSRGGWTMVLEDNGFSATQLPQALSRYGTAVIVFNNVNADCEFQYARTGRLIRDFDPMLYADNLQSPPLPQERGIGFGHGPGASYISQSLLLAQRLTGLRIRPADLDLGTYPLGVGAMI